MKRWKLPHSGWQLLIIVLLIFGIFFRFYNIDQKVYWYDESFTSLRVSGYTEAEAVEQLSDAGVIGIDALKKYQHFSSEKSLIDTLKSLASEDPQHPPLYYIMARFWAQGFGSSVAAMRTLPALLSLLALPCTYWLCLELFESSLTGWIATGLIAISPFHVLYAQEAREYSFWSVTILLSSAALLQAIRVKNKVWWGIYAVTLAVGFYTFLFSGLVAIGHGIYVVVLDKFRWSKTLVAYLIASLVGILAVLPWIWVVITNFSHAQKLTAWTSINKPVLHLVRAWIANTSRIFLDVNYSPESPLIYLIPITLAILAIASLVGYSFYFLCRQAPKRVWLFVLTLIGVTGFALILPDLVLGGIRSTISRFLIPCYLGIQLAVAYLLASQLTRISPNIWQHKFWKIVILGLFSFGVLSCTVISQAEVWWIKLDQTGRPAVAEIINQATRPLLISDAQTGDLLSFSYLLNPKVRLLIKPQCGTCNIKSPLSNQPYIPDIPTGFSDVFLFKPRHSQKWLDELKKEPNYNIELVYPLEQGGLWKLEKR